MKRRSKMKALIVDDEVELAAMVAQRLRAGGFEVGIESDGRAGLDRAASWTPDVILLDLSMPELDGWQLCRELSKDERTAHIPRIIMTAWATADLAKRAEDAGATTVIIKPFDERLLTLAVTSVARAKRQRWARTVLKP